MSAVDEHVTNEGPPVAFTDLGVRADTLVATVVYAVALAGTLAAAVFLLRL